MLICKMPPRRIAIQEPSCLGGTELLPEQPQLLQFAVKPQTWGKINSFSLTIRGGEKKKKKVMLEGSVAAKRVAVR